MRTAPRTTGRVPDFLAEQMFGRWDIVLHYDLGRGLRSFAGRSEKRLKEMVALATRRIGDLSTVKNDPAIVMGLLDLLVRENVMAAPEKRLQRRDADQPGVVPVPVRASRAA